MASKWHQMLKKTASSVQGTKLSCVEFGEVMRDNPDYARETIYALHWEKVENASEDEKKA